VCVRAVSCGIPQETVSYVIHELYDFFDSNFSFVNNGLAYCYVVQILVLIFAARVQHKWICQKI